MKKRTYTSAELSRFCKNLALLTHVGLPLSDSLFLMGQEAHFGDGDCTAMGQCLDGGASLSQAMEANGCFPKFAAGLVRIGEQTGQLEDALQRLAAYYESRNRTQTHLREVLTYPLVLMAMMLAVIAVLLVKVLPVFEEVYISLGSHMTGISAALLRLGQGLSMIAPLLLAGAAGILVLVVIVCSVPAFRAAAAAAWQKTFGDRGLSRKFNNAQFAKALAMGFHSGLPLSEAMDLAGQLLADIPGAAERAGEGSRRISEGISLTTALQEAKLLDAASCAMLSVGLRSGNGEPVMDEIAERMLEDAESALDRAVARLEPTMVLLCSVLVGLILLSVMLPLIHTLSAIG